MSNKRSFNIDDSKLQDNQLTKKTIINDIHDGKIANLEFIRKSPGKYVYQDIKTKKTRKLVLENSKKQPLTFLETDKTLGDLFIDEKKKKYYLNTETRKFISLKSIHKTMEDVKMSKTNKIKFVKSYSFVLIKGNRYKLCESLAFPKEKMNVFFNDCDSLITMPDGTVKDITDAKERTILAYMAAELKETSKFEVKGIVTDNSDTDLVVKYPISESEFIEAEVKEIRDYFLKTLKVTIR